MSKEISCICSKERELGIVATEIKDIKDDIKEIKELLTTDVKELKISVNKNTIFRNKANGIIGAVAFLCTGFGAFLVWLFSFIGGKVN